PLPKDEELRAELIDSADLALGVILAANPRGLSAAPAGKIGHCSKRFTGASETGDQLAKSNGANAGRSHQPQALDHVLVPIRGSVPFARRRIFSRCFHKTSNAKPSSIASSTE